MKEYEWRKRFAPKGYRTLKQRLGFDALHYAWEESELIQIEIERMNQKLYDASAPDLLEGLRRVHTFIRLYPMEVGENMNHLDKLGIRLGIEIEMRLPAL